MNVIKNIMIFASGALIGAFASFKYLDVKYEEKLKADTESVKKAFRKEHSNADISKPDKDIEKPKAKKKPTFTKDEKESYSSLSSIYKPEPREYINYSTDQDTEDIQSSILIITEDEFDLDEEYEKLSYSLYSDGIICSDMDGLPCAAPGTLMGEDNIRWFENDNSQVMYIRNGLVECDVEITKDTRRYYGDIVDEEVDDI